MRFSNTAKNLMLDALDESIATGAKFGSLHTAYSATGTNEVTGGSPAYARKGATWGAAASGAKATTASMVFDVPAGTTVLWVGFWDAATVGNFLGMVPNGGGTPQAFVVSDTTNDWFESVGHGFSDGNTVVVWAVPGDPLPTGVSEGTVYYVVSSTTDHYKLSATSGGAAINITAIGAGFAQRLVGETFGAQGTHTVSTATMTLD